MDSAQDIDWSLVRWDDFATWPDLLRSAWPQQYRLQATAALIRDFSKIDVRVEDRGDGTYTVVGTDHFRLPLMHGDDAEELLEGFQLGCEAMAMHWVCAEQPDPAALDQ